MQFPVPQFTDVEDKLIGSLTFKQFGIVFGAGIVIFLAYSVAKSILVLVFFALLVGLPAVALAFGKINGRPMYNSIAYYLKYISSPKVLVFHKEINNMTVSAKIKDVEIRKTNVTQAVSGTRDPLARLKEVNKILEKNAAEEKVLLRKKQES